MVGLFFLLWSFALSAAVVVYTLNPAIVALCAVAAVVGARYFRGVKIFLPWQGGGGEAVIKGRLVVVFFFFILLAAGFALLAQGAGDAALLSPWQTIHPWFLPVFFLLTACVGFLVLSGYQTRTILLCIVLYVFLQHLYLPASHELPWGGDVWRHVAVEEKLAHGEIQPPGLPEALTIPHKYTYGQLWGGSAALGLITRAPLVMVNRWLMPVLWSVAAPLLLFQLGLLLFGSRRLSLFLAYLPAMSFPFQALGALTLPVSLGFLTFLFTLLVWFRYLETGEKKIKILALLLAGLMAFGYALYVVLMWFVIGITWISKNKKIYPITHLFSPLLFPLIDLAVGGSSIPATWNMFSAAKQFIGQFSGWYYASAIRPHDIVSGNIFFNHIPAYAFVENFFTVWRWWVIPAMLMLWGVAATGFLRAPKDLFWRVLQGCAACVVGGYVIGWYVLEGDRLFTRRLDLLVAFLAIVFFLQGVHYFSRGYQRKAKSYQLVAIALFAFFTTATYASGPDMRVVSRSEYAAAERVWAELRTQSAPHCVLADTWVLLPLEAMSAGKIIGGGFPIDYQFGQPDRVRLYEEMKKSPSERVLAEAKKITGARDCVFVP